MRKSILALVVLALFPAFAEEGASLPSSPATFANPVIPHDFPDPTFWAGGDGWFYGTATGGGTLKTIHRSRDLVAWEDTKQPTIAPADLPKLHAFARTFWAPDMVKVGDAYRLYVTQFVSSDTNRLVVLTGAKPQGPFRFAGVVVENWKFGKKDLGIDSEVVRDADGWPWFETGALLPRENKPRVTVR